MTGSARKEGVVDAAFDAVRASIEAAERIARESLDAGTEAGRRVMQSLGEARDALFDGAAADDAPRPTRKK